MNEKTRLMQAAGLDHLIGDLIKEARHPSWGDEGDNFSDKEIDKITKVLLQRLDSAMDDVRATVHKTLIQYGWKPSKGSDIGVLMTSGINFAKLKDQVSAALVADRKNQTKKK